MAAIKKMKAEKEARKNFGEKPNVNTTVDDDWGSDDEDEDSPW